MVFHGHGHGWHCNFLHPEFLHCFVLHRAGEAPHYDWVVTDYRAGQPVIEQVADASYTVESLKMFYSHVGMRAVPTVIRPFRAYRGFGIVNCVTLTKAIIGLRAPLVITPRQLYRRLNSSHA